MDVKCRACQKAINRDSAYKVRVNNKNEYYCSLNEYVFMNEEKENRRTLFHTIDEIFGYTITNTAMNKEITQLGKVYTYTKLLSYVTTHISDLNKFMSKSFNSEYGKIRYFATILKNNIRDFQMPKQEVIKNSNVEIIETKYKPKERKKTMIDYIDEVD